MNLKEIEAKTLGNYASRAQDFWDGTKDHDVTQNRDALLKHIKGDAPYTILDFGCGPGRDLQAFKELGHNPIGLDGCDDFCKMAREFSDCKILQQSFFALDLPDEHFDGIFANASLFHVPKQELPKVLTDLYNSLKPGGVLMSSNPRGDNQEEWIGDRYGAFHQYEEWRKYPLDCNFTELEHYYRPIDKPIEEQNWLVTLFRK